MWRPTFSSHMLWTKGTLISKLCQKAWYIRIRPWKRKNGSVKRRVTGVTVEKARQSLSFSFAQLSLQKPSIKSALKEPGVNSTHISDFSQQK